MFSSCSAGIYIDEAGEHSLLFSAALLVMMCYCVPVLVSLGCVGFEVLPVFSVVERKLVRGVMGNANVVPAV